MGAPSKHERGVFSHLSSFPQFRAVLCSFTDISRRCLGRGVGRGKKRNSSPSRNRRVHLIRLEHPGIITACLIRLFTVRLVMSSFYRLRYRSSCPIDSSIVGTSRSPAPAANGESRMFLEAHEPRFLIPHEFVSRHGTEGQSSILAKCLALSASSTHRLRPYSPERYVHRALLQFSTLIKNHDVNDAFTHTCLPNNRSNGRYCDSHQRQYQIVNW